MSTQDIFDKFINEAEMDHEAQIDYRNIEILRSQYRATVNRITAEKMAQHILMLEKSIETLEAKIEENAKMRETFYALNQQYQNAMSKLMQADSIQKQIVDNYERHLREIEEARRAYRERAEGYQSDALKYRATLPLLEEWEIGPLQCIRAAIRKDPYLKVKKIELIKMYRNLTNEGLKESKETIELWLANETI